jgi:hypothetical protein
VNIFDFLLSYVLLVVGITFNIEGWRRILITNDEKLSFRQALRLTGRTVLAKYITGGVWFAAGRVVLGRVEGLSPQRMAVSTGLESVFLLLPGSLLAIVLELLLFTKQFSHTLMAFLLSMVE